MIHHRYSPDALPSRTATPTSGHMFMCAACCKPRLVPGRRRKLHRGVMSWVCKTCDDAPQQPKGKTNGPR